MQRIPSFAHLHVFTSKPCRHSMNVVRQVFCGLLFGLLPSSGVQLMATFAGLSQHMTVQSHPPSFHYLAQRFHPIASRQLLVTHMVTPCPRYSQYFPDTTPLENVQGVTDLCCRCPRFTDVKRCRQHDRSVEAELDSA